MARQFLTPVGLPTGAALPATGAAGNLFYLTTDSKVYQHNGTAWVAVSGLPAGGSTGEFLAKVNNTDYSVTWTSSAPTAGYTSVVKHEVKLGEAIAKGQAVYASSADGTNMVVSKASNATEATSSKTIGLLEAGGALNAKVNVVTEGLLSGLNTSTASAGDPVWLGTAGNLIYGLASKPVAPAHLVFLGVVTRANSSNGEIFVKVQNGFELRELHTVLLEADASIADNEVLAYDSASTLWKNQTSAEANLAQLSGGNSLTGQQLIVSSSTSATGLIVRAIGSQSVDLLQVQNDTGATVLAKVDTSGNITTVAGFFSNVTGQGSITLGDAAITKQSGSSFQFGSGGTFTQLVVAPTFTSNVLTGTAPLTVTSTTKVTNLNADLLDGFDTAQTTNTASTVAVRDGSGSLVATSLVTAGYRTTGAGLTFVGQWTRIATFNMTSQFVNSVALIDFSSDGPGNTDIAHGRLFVSVKQQNPMASAPEPPTVILYNGFNVTIDDFALVLSQNDATATRFDLYFRNNNFYQTVGFLPIITNGAANVTWYSSQPYVVNLPEGFRNNTTNPPETEVTPIDDLSVYFNGVTNRFLLTHQGTRVSLANPFRLLLTVNGVTQTVNTPSYTWQSPLPYDGFFLDSDGFVTFSEAPTPGYTFDGRIMAGAATSMKTKNYPFRAVDLLIGA